MTGAPQGAAPEKAEEKDNGKPIVAPNPEQQPTVNLPPGPSAVARPMLSVGVQTMVPAADGWVAVFELGARPEKRSVASWMMLDTGDGVPSPASIVGGVGPLRIPEMTPHFVGYEGPGERGKINWEAVCQEAGIRRVLAVLGSIEWVSEDADGKPVPEGGIPVRYQVNVRQGLIVLQVLPAEDSRRKPWRWNASVRGQPVHSGAAETVQAAQAEALREALLRLAGGRG